MSMTIGFYVWYTKYNELVEAMGYDTAFSVESALPPHEELVKKIKELADKAWMYDDLCN